MENKKVKDLNVSPTKRTYYSIIVDYDLNKSICELIDNALDIWYKNGKNFKVEIKIKLDRDKKSISITDNVGGIKLDDLECIVAPGLTSNDGNSETIGYFGVGSKRAVVALSSDIKIYTHHPEDKTFVVAYNDDWLKKDNEWILPAYETEDIESGKTIIQLEKLRNDEFLNKENIDLLQQHLEMTYAFFLKDSNVSIKIDDTNLEPIFFNQWADVPTQPPQVVKFPIYTNDYQKVLVSIEAGLIQRSSPSAGDYGVYFYCNDRLIAKAVKDINTGFVSGIIGLPHPSLAFARVLVSFKGNASLMPWNSNKSFINADNEIFKSSRQKIIETTKHFTSLSRRLSPDLVKNDYGPGKPIINNFDAIENVRINFPILPSVYQTTESKLELINKKILQSDSWKKEIYESIISSEIIFKKNFEYKNNIGFILMDIYLDIALKKFILENLKIELNTSIKKKLSNRDEMIELIKANTKYNNSRWKKLWEKLQNFHSLRYNLITSSDDICISDDELSRYKHLLYILYKELFGLEFNLL